MNVVEWSKSSIDYGQKLVNSALKGAQEGENEFLKEELLTSQLTRSAKFALLPTAVGALLGALSASLASRRRSSSRALGFGVLGGAIGFSAGVIWQNRDLAARVASGAWKKLNQTRDEHWFEKHPIDYA